jgi:hypothetical protein
MSAHLTHSEAEAIPRGLYIAFLIVLDQCRSMDPEPEHLIALLDFLEE